MSFEGSDQVGKGDAVENFSKYISSLGHSTCTIAFPYYAIPFGYIIRDILINGFPSFLKFENSNREVNVKMALFALNRLEVLNCILQNTEFDIYVLDRGPYSSPLTISYHIIANPGQESDIDEYLNSSLEVDSFFRKKLNIDNCVICLKHEGIEWEKSRKMDGGDLFEKKEVQDRAGQIYQMLEKRVGLGWKNVVTKDKSGWKDRDEICKESFQFAKNRGVIPPKGGKYPLEPTFLGIEEIQKYLYHGSQVDSELRERWLSAVGCNDKGEVYRVSKDISTALVGSTERISWEGGEIVLYIKALLDKYPEIWEIVEYMYGKIFLSKLKDSVK